MVDGEKNAEMPTTTKREKSKGHYRLVTRNHLGRIVSVSSWSSKSGKDSRNISKNRFEELVLIAFTTMPQRMEECNIKECKYNTLKWFYDQVTDILQRQIDDDKLGKN